jgi:hypothetical protein
MPRRIEAIPPTSDNNTRYDSPALLLAEVAQKET